MRTGGVPTSTSSELVGRREELAAVVRALENGGCLIAGASGVGKSRLAVEATTGEPVVHRILATATAAAIPFGAVSHLLPADVGADHAVIPGFIGWLREGADSSSACILVDDAHLLDAGSAALIHAVVTSGAARVVLTIRSGEPTPDAVSSLWKDQGLERIELQPLGRHEVGEMVSHVLGGDVHAAATARVFDLTQGNPLFVDVLVREARRSGALHEVSGRWLWREELLGFERTRLVVERRVHKMSAGARRALEFLAIGAPLPLAILADLTSAQFVEELEDLALVTLTSDHDPIVNIAHPMFGEVVAAELPVTTGRRLRRELAAALDAAGADDLRVATWQHEAGERDPERFLAASDLARQRGDPELAERLAAAAGRSLSAALARAAALASLARFDDVESTLAPYEDDARAAGIDEAERYIETRIRALLRGGGSQAAELFLERAADWHTGPAWSAVVAIGRAWGALYAREHRSALAIASTVADDTDAPAALRFGGLAIASLASIHLVRVDDLVSIQARMRELTTELPIPPWEAAFAEAMFENMIRILDGRDLLEATSRLEAAAAAAEKAGNTPLFAAATWGLGSAALQRGHADAAISALQLAADTLERGDPGNILVSVLGDLVYARFLHGDHVGVREALAQLERVAAVRTGTLNRSIGEVMRARAIGAAAEGRLLDAQEMLLSFAEQEEDDPGEAFTALTCAAVIGADPGRIAERLQVIQDEMQSHLAPLLLDHCRALIAGDPGALLEVALAYRDRHMDMQAAQAASVASRAFRSHGHGDSSLKAAALATQAAQRCRGTAIPGLVLDSHVPNLTPREHEIALLVARGLSNKDIAEQLVLSVRTVESTVLRACRKMGADSRHALADLVTP